MAYVSVPKDLSKVKSKFLGNLTKRQTICFGCGAALGLPSFFLLKSLNASAATLCMIIIMMPFFLLAMYEKNGQPLEKIFMSYLNVKFLRPKDRPYKTNNLYSALSKQANLDKEVKRIVNKKDKLSNNTADQATGQTKAQTKRKEAYSRSNRKSKGNR